MFADVEDAFRTWLRKQPGTSVLKAITFAFPTTSGNGKVVYPICTLSRIGGLPEVGVPVDRARLSFQVWATSKKDASAGAVALSKVLHEAENVQLSEDVWLYGVTLDTVNYSPVGSDGLRRYVIDVTAIVRSTT